MVAVSCSNKDELAAEWVGEETATELGEDKPEGCVYETGESMSREKLSEKAIEMGRRFKEGTRAVPSLGERREGWWSCTGGGKKVTWPAER